MGIGGVIQGIGGGDDDLDGAIAGGEARVALRAQGVATVRAGPVAHSFNCCFGAARSAGDRRDPVAVSDERQ